MKKVFYLFIGFWLSACTKEILTHKLSTDASPLNGGSVTPPSNSFEHGQQVSLNATPNGEYVFKNWQGSLSGTTNPTSLLMDADKQVTGVFEKRQYPLNLTIEGNGTVKEEVIAVANQAQYPSGTTVKLTGRANPGSIFSEWKGDKTGTDSVLTILVSKPFSLVAKFMDKPLIPAINTDLFPNLNWNDHAAGKNAPYDFNNDQIPDIVSYRRVSEKSILPSIFEIKDYTGTSIFSFDLKAFKPAARDSLQHIMVDYQDLNNDGFYDFGLSYMGEWWTGQPGAPGSKANYIGNNIYLLLSKGKFQFDVIEILDEPNKPLSFNISLFDWDFDGKQDVLLSDYNHGDYLKNLGNNRFERRKLGPPLFNQSVSNKLDFDGDGLLDYVNLYINQIDENGNYTSKDMSQTLSVMNSKGVSNFPVVGKTLKKYIYMTGDIISVERIAMVDGDGDGDKDLIVGSCEVKPNSPWYYLQEYFENTGKQFEYRPNYIEIDKKLIGELQVWTGDVDKDGDVDLFYPTYRKSQLNGVNGAYFWWENTKKGFKINKDFYLKY
ncbi:InlB B-repeat-containing protein [Aquirufa sp. 5-AUSEE-100C1]